MASRKKVEKVKPVEPKEVVAPVALAPEKAIAPLYQSDVLAGLSVRVLTDGIVIQQVGAAPQNIPCNGVVRVTVTLA